MTADIRDHPEVAAALLGGPHLTDELVQILEILLNPENEPDGYASTVEGVLEELMHVSGDMFVSESISGILRGYFHRTTGEHGHFEFELLYSESDGFSAYSVMTRIQPDFWLSVTQDAKYLDPERYDELPVLHRVLRVTQEILHHHSRLVEKRNQLAAT